MTRKHIAVGDNKIEYEYRPGRVLIMFCYLANIQLTALADSLELCSQIETVLLVKKYDSDLSAIIAHMKVGYNASISDQEIEYALNNNL